MRNYTVGDLRFAICIRYVYGADLALQLEEL